MEFTSIQPFLDHYENVRQRTMNVVRCIPRDKVDWSYAEGKFTLGDLVRHIGAVERYMFAECAQGKPNKYAGHGKELAESYDELLAFLERTHQESMAIFGKLTPEDLQKKCPSPSGKPITTWKFLRALVEHEIHHRGQIYTYLGMLGAPVPSLYGFTEPQVRAATSVAE
jgi:uncharacterized damage-inducible protein DinB